MKLKMLSICLTFLGMASIGLHGQPFNVNTASRETVRSFYNRVYQASEGVAIGWTGNIDACNAGTVSQAFQDATLLRVNWFRAMAGMPSNITFTQEANAKAQAAALMMAANRSLDHNPPNTWKCYTALGAEGAASNLSMGSFGPKSIDRFMLDSGASNHQVGHRRWILLPSQQTMGAGHIPGAAPNDWQTMAAALWVHDPKTPTRPATREAFVAWPPKGFVPYQTVYPRWSFGLPNADFNTAVVTMQRNGTNIPVKIESRGGGFGDPAIVWIPNNLNHSATWPRPAADEVFTVNVNNVIVGGTPQNFTYQVTVFDPQVPGPDTVRAVITGVDRPTINQDTTYNFTPVPIATGYEWRVTRLVPLNLTDGAENGLANFDAAVGNYNPVSTAVKATGNAAFRLHRSPYSTPQSLTFKRAVIPNQASQITFKSRMSLAASYSAAVQVSTDGGTDWQTVYTQPGNDQTEPAFTDKVVSLAAYADRQIQIRFSLVFGGGGAFISDTAGWFFDDVNFVNIQEPAQAPTITPVAAGTSFVFRPAEAADFALDVRARVFGKYSDDWGPAKRVSTATNLATAPTITTQPQGRTVVPGADVTFNVVAQGTMPLTYLWKHNGTDLNDGAGVQGSRTAALTLQNVQAARAGNYTVQITNGAGNVTSAPAVLVLGEALSLASALDTTGLTWTTSGNVNWAPQTTVSQDNVDSAKSGAITHNQESRMETTITGPATVAFWWKVESEQNYDWLRVELNGTQQFRISGNINWQARTVAVPAGQHTLRWVYAKDASVSAGADSGWVDRVEVRQAQPPPSLADALDNAGIQWASAGNQPWFAQTTVTRDGTDALQSGPVADNQFSRLEATVLGPANLTFWWKVSSEQNFDFLSFDLNGAPHAAAQPISGDVDWQQKTVPIPAGTHRVRWSYTKDGSASAGSDAAYLDQVVLTRLTPGEAGEPGPQLEYTASGNKLRLTWPEVAVNYKLQVATSLMAGDWTDVSENDIFKEEGEFFLILNMGDGTRFYRLTHTAE